MEMVIFVGLPASGKSTFFQKRFSESHAHISKDKIPNARRPAMRQMQLIEDAFAQNKSVVIDNTNPRVEDRLPLIEAARRAGASVTCYFFDASVASCLARNERRVGKSRVPKVAIFTAAKRMRSPALQEGYDHLYRVTIAEKGEFLVEQITR